MPKIKRVEHSKEYVDAHNTLKSAGDNNFCSPVALAMVTGISVADAAERMGHHGRKLGKATPNEIFNKVLIDLGFTGKRVLTRDMLKKLPRPHCDVLKNLTTHHPRRFPGVFDPSKKYIAEVNGHILAIVGGEVKDWSVNRSLRILRLFEIDRSKKD